MKRSGIIVCVCLAVTLAVPVPKNSQKDSTNENSNVPVVRDQERQLEYLASLADQPNGIDLEKVQTFKFTNINGKEKGVKETKNKVNGELVSDIKEKFKQDALSGKTPEIKTEIDLPKEGIHKVLNSENDNNIIEETPLEDADTFDFNPEDVAAYLFQSDDTEMMAFDKTLQGLVNASIMTPGQASEYKEQVRQAFNKIVLEAARAETEQIAAESFPGLYDNPVDEDIYDLLGYQDLQNSAADLGPQEPAMPSYPVDDSLSLSGLIKNAMDEWLTNAIVTGDRDAEAFLTNILTEVSKDDNPDDLGQMRELLMDFFTNEVLDSMVPRDQMEELPYFENKNELPQQQIIPEENNEITKEVKSQELEPTKEEEISNEIPNLTEKDKKSIDKEPTEEEKEKLKM